MFTKIYNALGVKGIVVTLSAFLFIIFCVQNTEPVAINFFFWELTQFPKLYLLVLLTLFGFVGGFVVGKFGFKRQEPKVESSGPNII